MIDIIAPNATHTMTPHTTAKIFRTGRSQAVRLPAAFRFDTDEVFVRRDQATGDVILSARPENWDGFFAMLAKANVPADFLDKDERAQITEARDPFGSQAAKETR